ncbi:hypothetical protein N7533_002462 [Penicillium manginii]|uniref:uncharacterized protein n=1 Tax=Penicillium manginii TaxID=203109 RepID=UPI002548A3E7|nr:uncharacterized protein N7533_002462 [Penicillium manginii]KAJ5763781.1 hypothetical protein N7533_002462 [Penicillium manginii]
MDHITGTDLIFPMAFVTSNQSSPNLSLISSSSNATGAVIISTGHLRIHVYTGTCDNSTPPRSPEHLEIKIPHPHEPNPSQCPTHLSPLPIPPVRRPKDVIGKDQQLIRGRCGLPGWLRAAVPLGLWLFPLLSCILRPDRISCWKFRLSHCVHGDLPGANGFLVPDPNSPGGGVEGVQHWSTHNPTDGDDVLSQDPLSSLAAPARETRRGAPSALLTLVHGNSVNRALKIAMSDSICELFCPFASTPPREL